MRIIGRLALGLVLIFALLVAAVLVRTFTFKRSGRPRSGLRQGRPRP